MAICGGIINSEERRKIMSRKFIFGIKLLGSFFVMIAALICFIVMPALALERFVNNGDDTVTDTKTGLMWAAKDHGDLINWQSASSYCQNYSGGGYTDWRMPTLTELATLYDPKIENKHGYHVSKLIDISASSCWASDTNDNRAARFNFTYGKVYWLYKSFSGSSRVLPVRNGK
jgi:hypothetical protein